MDTIAIIPARGGSKRLPNKNIKLLNNIPLLVYSIRYAQEHSFIKDVYVSTDDAQIKEVALKHGAKVVDRPQALSDDFQPTVTALKHVLEEIADPSIENVVLLQATNPLRPTNLLNTAFSIYINNKLDSLFTVSQNKNKLGKIKNNIFIPFNYKIGQRSQDLEPLYFENGLLYISKAFLIFDEKIISDCAYPMVVDHIFSTVDIDTIEDFKYAEFLLNNSI